MIPRPLLAGDSPWLLHVGLYAYRRDYLLELTRLPRLATGTTRTQLEQLRPLQHGAAIGVSVAEHSAVGIDTPDDYARFVVRSRGLSREGTGGVMSGRRCIRHGCQDGCRKIQMAPGQDEHGSMAKHIFRDRGRGQFARQGADLRIDRAAARAAWLERADAETRSLHQRRSGDDESLPARRGVRSRRRGRDRSGPGSLRAVHQQPALARLQLHHWPDLPERDRQGAAGRVSRQDRPGGASHHQRDQGRRLQSGHVQMSTW